MESFFVLKFGLVLHFIGIAMMVGFTFASFVSYRKVWKFLPAEKNKAMVVENTISSFQLWQMLGGVLIVTGGVFMMIVYQHTIMQTLWFKIKMIVLLAIILNFVIIGRPALTKLKIILNDSNAETGSDSLFEPSKVFSIRRRVLFFHALQIAFFILIFILAAFRFN